jgi:hypothetical protein
MRQAFRSAYPSLRNGAKLPLKKSDELFFTKTAVSENSRYHCSPYNLTVTHLAIKV